MTRRLDVDAENRGKRYSRLVLGTLDHWPKP